MKLNFLTFDSGFGTMETDRFYLRYQNIFFGWLHLIFGIIGSIYAGYRAFVDLLKAKSASDLDSTYLRYVMLHLETIMCIVCFFLIWISMIFIAGVQKRHKMMMTPYIVVCILSLIASFFLIFKNLLFIILFVLYLYLVAIGCRLYKLILDSEKHVPNDVRRYESNQQEPPSIIPTIFRPRTPRNERPARNNNTNSGGNGGGNGTNGSHSREAEV
ncbi:hypothetical protein PVAND_017527 [Polypedilum vanderplanki]|uniref:Uncharacterized protein n=1 Tax=Polypedilum vanderplanki TaxID=319348 RepID=A0A9J6BJA9_POLVA|nr:hypothetical protein PVAND_017527 [Polypedilum vanderplanki]